MATYIELFDLGAGNASGQNDGLRSRVAVALAVEAAVMLALASPTQKQLDWALSAVNPANVAEMAKSYLSYLLAANKSLTTAQLVGVADSDLQAAVHNAVLKVTA